MTTNKKIDVHKFITTIYNPNLNEFFIPASDTGMGPSINEGRIIYGKNKLHLSSDGYSLFQIRDDLFHLGASQSSDWSVDYDSFLLSLEPLYRFYLKNKGSYLSKKIEAVFESTDLMLETNYFGMKLAKNEIYQEDFSLHSRNVNPVKVKKSYQGYNIYQGKKLLGIESPPEQHKQKKFSEGINEKIVPEEGCDFDSSSGFTKKKEDNEDKWSETKFNNDISLDGPQKWEECHQKKKINEEILTQEGYEFARTNGKRFKGIICALLCFALIGLYVIWSYNISDVSSINYSWISNIGKGDVQNYYYGKTNDFISFVTYWGWLVYYIPIPLISLTTEYNVVFIEKLFGFTIGLIILFITIFNYKKTSIVVLILLVAVFVGSFEYERCTTRNFQNRNELSFFLAKDRTNTLTYTTSFKCEDFARTLMQAANKAGYRIYYYTIPNHAMNKAFLIDENTWVEIEPQTDEIKIAGS